MVRLVIKLRSSQVRARRNFWVSLERIWSRDLNRVWDPTSYCTRLSVILIAPAQPSLGIYIQAMALRTLDWQKLPVTLAELCLATTLRCGQSFRFVP